MINNEILLFVVITSEAEGRASSTENKILTLRKILSVSGPPAVVTLFRGLYLLNRKPD